MDPCRIHGGSIPRWQSRLGEESCSYPVLPMATSVQPGGADGAVDDLGRSSTARVDFSPETANLAGCRGEKTTVMRWRFQGAATA